MVASLSQKKSVLLEILDATEPLLVVCLWLLIKYSCNLLYSQTEDAPCNGDKDQHKIYMTLTKFLMSLLKGHSFSWTSVE